MPGAPSYIVRRWEESAITRSGWYWGWESG